MHGLGLFHTHRDRTIYNSDQKFIYANGYIDLQMWKTSEIQEQPFCVIEIQNGKCKKNYKFDLKYVKRLLVGTCGPGCMSLFDDVGDTEYLQEYNYSKKYDDWILTRDQEVLKYENNKEVNKLSDVYLTGISGKKYKIKKITKKK